MYGEYCSTCVYSTQVLFCAVNYFLVTRWNLVDIQFSRKCTFLLWMQASLEECRSGLGPKPCPQHTTVIWDVVSHF